MSSAISSNPTHTFLPPSLDSLLVQQCSLLRADHRGAVDAYSLLHGSMEGRPNMNGAGRSVRQLYAHSRPSLLPWRDFHVLDALFCFQALFLSIVLSSAGIHGCRSPCMPLKILSNFRIVQGIWDHTTENTYMRTEHFPII